MRVRMQSFRSRVLVAVAAFAIAASGMTIGAVLAPSAAEPAEAAVASQFDPGYLISDANFYNGAALSAGGVQSFLNSAGSGCRQASGGPVCLKDFSQSVGTIGAVSGRCAAIPGGVKSAATIIAQVGSACNISQKALIVLLEKEQSIISARTPTNYMYQHATGFACPDTAPCDPAYRGFAQQVYAAGLQFQRYKANPTLWAYRAGRVNNILYNPNGACGTKPVYIQNAATAALYIYTPYTPNQAALNNLYGSGDGCSAYGNRNFWRIYTDWFGTSTGGTNPIGATDAVSAGYGTISLSGWAADRDTTDPIQVAISIDGTRKATISANAGRSDLAGVLGSGNTAHGFSTTIRGLTKASHRVCVDALNVGVGANTRLSCDTIAKPTGAPKAYIDQATGAGDTLTIRGWAFDPDSSAATKVQIRVDGHTKATVTANATKSGLDASYPGYGDKHGFSATVKGITGGGKHPVCLHVQDLPKTTTKQTTCQTVSFPSGSPIAKIDAATSSAPGSMSVKGWAVDPDTTGAIKVAVTLDGKFVANTLASRGRGGIDKKYPGYGNAHGFLLNRSTITPGKHTVCIVARNTGKGSDTKQCTTFSTPTGSPVVTIERAVSTALGKATIRGWAIDPDVVDPVAVRFTVDGKDAGSMTASLQKPGLDATKPGYGLGHKFEQTFQPGAGSHRVCVVATNVGGGKDTSSCVTVAPYGSTPTVFFDQTSSSSKGDLRVRGWAVDPDTADAIEVDMYLDGKGLRGVQAEKTKPGLGDVFPGYGDDHAFDERFSGISSGSHSLCAYGINVGPGENAVACRTVTVQ